jgi:uncharacterized protein (DUF952 family)
VANAFYRGAGPLVLLTIDPDLLEAEIREESDGGAETFPHIYGPLPVCAVLEVTRFDPGTGGLFAPPTSWLSPKLRVRPSPIEGRGLCSGK